MAWALCACVMFSWAGKTKHRDFCASPDVRQGFKARAVTQETEKGWQLQRIVRYTGVWYGGIQDNFQVSGDDYTELKVELWPRKAFGLDL